MGRLLLDSSGGGGLPEGAVIGIIVGVCFAPFFIVVLCLICGCLCSGCRGVQKFKEKRAAGEETAGNWFTGGFAVGMADFSAGGGGGGSGCGGGGCGGGGCGGGCGG